MIEVKDIKKSFGFKKVLKGVNLTFEDGKVYGLVGLNGTGKSVLLKIILGLMKPNSGEVLIDSKVLGKDIKIIPDVGAIIESPTFYEDMSCMENLKELAAIYNKIGEKEIVECLNRLGLSETDSKPVKSYSLGMRQKLGLTQAFMENPKVIILDEPTNALDQESIEVIHEMILEKKKEGALIIIASHSSYDILKLCDKIYEIKDGVCHEKEKTN